jgi:four helix bundle protein
MLKPSRQPYGFKNLLAYRKAEELQLECARVTALFPKYKTPIALADQMDRSARSAKQNIVEGWKRNSTMEYYDFLGFSIGANTELEEDCNDIWKGVYRDLMGIKGVMGERGSENDDIEKIPFYPLDRNLPLVIQLKLRCKELNFLLHQLQKSLENKMIQEKTLSAGDRARKVLQDLEKNKKQDDVFLEQNGFVRLESGQVIAKQ